MLPITRRQYQALRAIYNYLRRYHAPCSQGDIAKALKIDPRTVRHHLAHLTGYITHHAKGKQGGYTLTPLACNLLNITHPTIDPHPPSRRIRNNTALLAWRTKARKLQQRLAAETISNSNYSYIDGYHIPIVD